MLAYPLGSSPPLRIPAMKSLLKLVEGRGKTGLPFEIFHLTYQAPDWGVPEEETRVPEGCVGWFYLLVGNDVLDWNVDNYLLSGLEHFQWLGTIPDLLFNHVHAMHDE